MKTFAITTLGCKVNQAETEKMISQFLEAGFELVDLSEEADVSIINTCTVTRQADHKSRQAIRRALQKPGVFVVATGCGVEMASLGRSSIEGVDLAVGNQDKGRLVSLVQSRLNGEGTKTGMPVPLKPHLHTRALVKVQDGCDHFCSFCIVALVRGKPASRPLAEVTKEVEALAQAGVKEIVVTGVNLGKYGQDLESGPDLIGLLKTILGVDGLGRVRLSSIELNDLTAEFIALFGQNQRFCRHLHVPLQSGSDRILQAMNRGYTAGEYFGKIDQLKAIAPDIALTTDVMVGFPGETDEDFEATRNLIEKIRFRKLHVFRFSPRPGTPAAGFPEQLSEEVKVERSRELIELGARLSWDYLNRFVGRGLEVLVEKKTKDGLLTGLSDNYIRVCFKGPSHLIGELVKVQAVEIRNNYLFSKLV